jgi:hypothetical protein
MATGNDDMITRKEFLRLISNPDADVSKLRISLQYGYNISDYDIDDALRSKNSSLKEVVNKYKIYQEKLRSYIKSNDEEKLRIALETNTKPSYDTVENSFKYHNINIITLLLENMNYNINNDDHTYRCLYQLIYSLLSLYNTISKYDSYRNTYETTDIIVHNNLDIINLLINSYVKNNVLDEILSYDDIEFMLKSEMSTLISTDYNENFSTIERNIFKSKIRAIKTNANNIVHYLYSVIFRSCVSQEISKLKETLKGFNIRNINGRPIDSIDATEELCRLIENGLHVDIHKFDINFDLIKPVVQRDINDDDDDDLN